MKRSCSPERVSTENQVLYFRHGIEVYDLENVARSNHPLDVLEVESGAAARELRFVNLGAASFYAAHKDAIHEEALSEHSVRGYNVDVSDGLTAAVLGWLARRLGGER